MKASPSRITRRRFMQNVAAIGATITFIPRSVRGYQANSKLQLATVGVGGMGASDRGDFMSSGKVSLVALCDVDRNTLKSVGEQFPDAGQFTDYREMFAKLGNKIDAVHIATPDHMHAPIAMTAINMGKHVYCQKPLTHEVDEARKLTLAARKRGVVTQMGIQIHSYASYRNAVELIRGGAIGKIREVHSWSNKTWGWEKGLPENTGPAPAHLDWENWIGTAPMRPYADGAYHPGNWRRWYDFGNGTMGDMGIHILDPVAGALELTAPKAILSESPEPFEYSFGIRNRVHYKFAGTRHMVDGCTITWYDGGYMPDTTDWPMPEGKGIPGQGSMFLGEKGAMLLAHIGPPILLPLKDFRDYPNPGLPTENHYHQWVNACLGEGKASADFDYSGPLSETLLLGVLSCRFPNQELRWDAAKLRFTNNNDANKLLKRQYRKGHEVKGLS